MSELHEKKCVPCEGGVDPIGIDQAGRWLEELPGWELSDDGKRIEREFSFKNFYRTMSFVNAVAHLANVENHHPDLQVSYAACTVTWTTHAIDGLSENDFICAARINRIDAF